MSHLPDDPADVFADEPLQSTSSPSAPVPESNEGTNKLSDSRENIFPDIGGTGANGGGASEQEHHDHDYKINRNDEPIPPNAKLHITVADPEKKGEGVYAYVSYKVNTKAEVDDQAKHYAVIRRYSDFAFLHEQLISKYPGWLIPPLPEKAIIGRFSPMFVDSRRRGLELFLHRIATHKELRKSEDFRLFLQGGQEFQDIREGKVKPQPTGKSKGFMDYFSELSQSVQTSLGASKERPKSKDDQACDSIAKYAESMETYITNVNKNVSTLTQRTKEIANAWFEFGFSCTLLGQYETEQEEQHLGNAFAKLGNCADRLSVHLTQMVDNQIVHFQEPFSDFLRNVTAVKTMLKSRDAALLTYHTALAALENKQATLVKYQNKAGKEDRALALESEVVEAQRRVDEELHQVQEITQHVFEEIARFRQEKRVDFKNNLLDFVRMQIENSKKVQKAWETILPEIESMPFEGEPNH